MQSQTATNQSTVNQPVPQAPPQPSVGNLFGAQPAQDEEAPAEKTEEQKKEEDEWDIPAFLRQRN